MNDNNWEELKILQHNCNRSTNVVQGLMEIGKEVDILAIQEPWIGKTGEKKKKQEAISIGNGEITVGNSNYHILYRARKGEEKGGARVM